LYPVTSWDNTYARYILGRMSTQELLDEGLIPTPGKRIRRSGLHPLTGIRFFAAAWVMAFHFGAAFTARVHMPHPITVFLEHGEFGVALFFMLSGFILYYTYQGNLQTSGDVYKFFVARVARLYPVYLLAIVIAIPLHERLPNQVELLIFPMLQSWVPPVSGIGYAWIIQAWTLSVEAFFYLCFPILLLGFRRSLSSHFLWILAAILLVVNVVLRTPTYHPLAPDMWLTRHIILPVLCLPEFLLGMVLGALFMQKRSFNPDSTSEDWLTFAGIVPCCVLIAAGVGSYLSSLAALLCFGWAIYRLADGRGWLTNFLSSKGMLLLGGASFSIYLLQSLIRDSAHRLLLRSHPGLDAVLSPFILITLSCLIFLFYEEPMRDLVRKVLTRKQARAKIAA
jgi:peptidoglycan/LPS O-acetylase OafA/YrhL